MVYDLVGRWKVPVLRLARTQVGMGLEVGQNRGGRVEPDRDWNRKRSPALRPSR